jgi:hypothetical protein
MSAALSAPKVPHTLQQALKELQAPMLCTLVSGCLTSAKEVRALIAALAEEDNQVVELAAGLCDKIGKELAALPVLPKALAFDQATGRISGVPHQLVQGCTYTVTAYNASGQCSADFGLTVAEPAAPWSLAYTLPAMVQASEARNQALARVLLVVGDAPLEMRVAPGFNPGLPAATFKVAPPLPDGLSIAADTGTISGAPRKEAPYCRYKVTAANIKGACEFEIPLEVQLHVPPTAMQYVHANSALSGHAQLYTLFTVGTDVHISPLAEAQKGTHLCFSVSPALPEGLQLSPDAGVISGRVREARRKTAYTVTATNKRGTAATTIEFATIQDYKQVPVTQWTADMVRAWLRDAVKCTDKDLLEFLGVDGRVLATCTSAETEPLASNKMGDTAKVLIAIKVKELVSAGPVSTQPKALMTAEQVAQVGACIGMGDAPPAKYYSSREDLIIGDPADAAHGLEHFMNITMDETWYPKLYVQEQVKAIEAEMRALAGDIHDAIDRCSADGQETDVFSTHLHYLTHVDGIKESLKRAGGGTHLVLNVQQLHAGLEQLAYEIIDFLEYVLHNTAGEKRYDNGVRDKGRPDVTLDYFLTHEKAQVSKLRCECMHMNQTPQPCHHTWCVEHAAQPCHHTWCVEHAAQPCHHTHTYYLT